MAAVSMSHRYLIRISSVPHRYRYLIDGSGVAMSLVAAAFLSRLSLTEEGGRQRC